MTKDIREKAMSLQRVMQALEPRFQIGETLYFIEDVYEVVTCNACHGARAFKVADKQYRDCGLCSGDGKVGGALPRVKSGKVIRISCHITTDIDIRYEVIVGEGGSLRIINSFDLVFNTEAQAALFNKE